MFFLILAIFLLILVWQCGRIQMIMCDRINLARSGENILSFVLHPKKNTTAWTWKKIFCRYGAYFVNNWLLTGRAGYNTADLNCDGEVEFDDFAGLASQWLTSCP